MTTAPAFDFEALQTAGAKIAQLRRAREWTGEYLAGQADISQSHLSYIEHGRRPAAPDVYRRIADALGVPASDVTPGEA